jgi:cyclopropane fatty-acyl-phospholipid synthase-like methyltransferase
VEILTRARARSARLTALPSPYDAIAEDWHAGRAGFAARRYVDLVLRGLERGARILDLGCGTGVPVARYLVGNGFRVVGVDESRGMLEVARREVPEAEFLQSDMREVEFAEPFAAVIAWDSVFHVARVDHQAVFQKISGFLRPDGRLLLSAGGSGHEGFTSEMFGHTFFYSGHEPDETLRLLSAAGFEVELCEEDDPSSRGHIAVVARKVARQ